MRLITEAGKKLLGLSKTVGKGIGGNFKKAYSDEHLGTLALNFAPDLVFGAMYGAQTPGDTSDKIIAGLGSGLGGAIGGVGLRGALGVRNPAIGLALDYSGSIGGDIVGQAASDQVLKVKGGGTTPWEKVQAEQYEQMKKQAKEELIQELLQQQRYQRNY
jgi:hypothetical protein